MVFKKETSAFGAEFVAMKHCIDAMRGLRYKLRMIGILKLDPSYIYGDDMSVVYNTSRPESALRKKSNSVCNSSQAHGKTTMHQVHLLQELDAILLGDPLGTLCMQSEIMLDAPYLMEVVTGMLCKKVQHSCVIGKFCSSAYYDVCRTNISFCEKCTHVGDGPGGCMVKGMAINVIQLHFFICFIKHCKWWIPH